MEVTSANTMSRVVALKFARAKPPRLWFIMPLGRITLFKEETEHVCSLHEKKISILENLALM